MWLAKNQIAMPTQVQLMHIIDDVIQARQSVDLTAYQDKFSTNQQISPLNRDIADNGE